MKDNVEAWIFCIIICVFIICLTIIICFNSTYTLNFTMDNNTMEAIKSVNWTAIAHS